MRKILFSIIASIAFQANAQSPTPAPTPAPAGAAVTNPSGKVRVVTRNVEPFSFEQNGRRVGFAMELWEDIAREAKLDYEVQVVSTAQEMVDALANKTADAAVGAISVTAKRETIVDFSQPFYNSGLQILVKASSGTFADSLWSLVSGLLNLKFIGMFALLIFTMLLISHFVWLYEHKVNDEEWPVDYKAGLWESFWWTTSVLLVGGAENKGPRGVGGRLVAIAWMLLSIVLVSLLTASFTTTLTVGSLRGGINGPNDLPGKKVASIDGSAALKSLEAKQITVLPFKTVDDCIVALKKGDVDAVVYDAPMLQYALNKSEDATLTTAGPMFDLQSYAIGLQQDSPLVEPINQALLAITESGVKTELNKKWFGSND